MKKKDEELAIFWCSLLEPVLFGEIESDEVHAYLRKIAGVERLFPDGKSRKPSLSTLKRKLRKYREGGFQALERKPRDDRGKPRAHGEALIERAIEIKRDQPRRSSRTINQILRSEHDRTIPKATLYRHLKKAGATRIKLGVLKKKVRRRFTRDRSNALWVGDFEHGPYVLHNGEPVATRLSAFIDCHSRWIVEGRYYYRETLDVLIDSLLRAWVTHGASEQLYLDNAKVYHSTALRAACYALNVRLIHRTPNDPAPGGLIERFFGTVQDEFEAEVRAGSILTLDDLNRSFSAWLEMSYHDEPHSETGQKPRERYQAGLTATRRVDMTAILPYFMKRVRRRVDPTFSDVQLDARFYQVDPRLRGDQVEVRFDPFSERTTVLLYSLDEQYLGEGRLHDRQDPQQPAIDSSPPKAKIDYLRMLREKHDRRLRQSHAGIDFRKAAASRGWSFPEFAQACARLLGRPGQLSQWSTDELEALKRSFDRIPSLTPQLLEQALVQAEPRTLPAVLFELQRLADQEKEI